MSTREKSNRGRSVILSGEGASALEFALIAPVLLALLFGMIEFGFVFHAQLSVTHAAREGARLAAVSEWDADVQTEVESRALPIEDVSAVMQADLDSVSVTVSHLYQWKVLPLGNPVELMSTATMRKE
ncbi:MAG: TadE/TadG family type IV pilus assembly protein [Anaerosomatales bacterium]|nr:TadE/TadG family type IV pilus assembly protein [Anaerosomatales bacterium]